MIENTSIMTKEKGAITEGSGKSSVIGKHVRNYLRILLKIVFHELRLEVIYYINKLKDLERFCLLPKIQK